MAVTSKEAEFSEKVQKLMSNPKNIRNIGIVAHIHHGKCIAPESRIQMTDGSLILAKDMFSLSAQKGKKALEEPDKIIYDISDLDLQTFSFNNKTKQIEKKKIQYAWKLKGGDVVKVRLRNGFEIKTTPEHKFLVLHNQDIAEKEAQELKLGDKIVCARHVDTESDINIKEFILRKLAEKNFYVRLKKEFNEELKEKIFESDISKIKLSLTPQSFNCGTKECRYLLKDLLELASLFKLDLEKIYDEIENVCWRNGKWRGKSSLYIKLPQNFESFFYLAGLFVGDGCRDRFIVGKQVLGEKFVQICKELKINAWLITSKNKTPYYGTNLTLMHILNSLFDYPVKTKSRNVHISELLFKAPKKYGAAFLRGYFDCDGTVEKSRRAISITSASKQMIEDIKLFLIRFNCIPIVNDGDDTLYLTGKSAKAFVSEIGFFLPEKMQKAEVLAQAAIGSYVTDIVEDRAMLLLKKSWHETLLQELAFIEVTNLNTVYEDTVYDFTVVDNHNFLAEGIIVHNTCLTDSLAAAAGMMASELVGEKMLTWIDEQEHERLMTIYGATVTMAHDYENERYLVNLLDTPGHVDFGADVTQAMRAVDGAVVMVCAVEGMMPQTETVLHQALGERVKPVLFINKVDRAIKELKLGPEALQKRLAAIVNEVNIFVQKHVEPQFAEKWRFSVENGTVAFGSALRNWAISIPAMKKFNITFKDIIDLCAQDKDEELAKKAPMHIVVLDMVVKHLPSPREAQKYRIERIWKGDKDSETYKALTTCNPEANLGAVVTKVVYDIHAGMISTTRIFSGKLNEGQMVRLVRARRDSKVQQLSTFIANRRIPIATAMAGNVVGIVGLSGIAVGETLSEPEHEIDAFEAIKHIFEPVVTKAIEPRNPQDLPKLIDQLKILGAEDPTLKIQINPDTGETLVSGLGELHLDAKVERKIREKGLDIVVSPPVVVYRETITKASPLTEGKSPNRHNRLFVIVEPLEEPIYKAIKEGKIPEMKIKKKKQEVIDALVEAGMNRDQAKQVAEIYKGNVLIEETRGIVHIGEIMEMVHEAFEEMMDSGPLTKEPCYGLRVRLADCKLHEDAIHRGPGQMIPCMRQAMANAMLLTGVTLFEPVQTARIDVPMDYLSEGTKLVNGRRGVLLDSQQAGERMALIADVPVSEMFGFEAALKSATAGRGFQSLIDVTYKKLPQDLQMQTVLRVRERKGLPKELPKPILD